MKKEKQVSSLNPIQWYPGHMAKAKRQVTEKMSMIDVVIELTDARLPESARNPMVDEMTRQRPKILVLNKSDLADQAKTQQWIHYYESQGIAAIAVDSRGPQSAQKIVSACQAIMKEKRERQLKKGRRPQSIRALIVGIPNVGKSTLINMLARKKVAKTGNRPGITTAQQWIKTKSDVDLLDTPGILWPKFEDPEVGYRLALTGGIKDDILDFQEVALYGLSFFSQAYPDALKDRYKLDELAEEPFALLEQIGEKRGCMQKGGFVDTEKAAELFLREVRGGQLCRLTLEAPGLHKQEPIADTLGESPIESNDKGN
ncbi:ribosome biogenesis GTPase YlqF [Aureibacillus halotolerans]|uniref:Ribosome biogenesis GTPase A n=1 Tax=Aureibacillus halotolerans TaxID=1508390 RepID=A0A4R6U9A5_9BACI|nr:ribosome biogenesis GTPase YlqF [Aureibacillus halotolerans]TDQ42406.1 Ras superfamily GTP-binding protein YlqF [Aureibacillus halotolerans]